MPRGATRRRGQLLLLGARRAARNHPAGRGGDVRLAGSGRQCSATARGAACVAWLRHAGAPIPPHAFI